VVKREVGYLLDTFHPDFHVAHYGTEPGGASDKLAQDMEYTVENFLYSNLRIKKVRARMGVVLRQRVVRVGPGGVRKEKTCCRTAAAQKDDKQEQHGVINVIDTVRDAILCASSSNSGRAMTSSSSTDMRALA
jgi:hypothetical protein